MAVTFNADRDCTHIYTDDGGSFSANLTTTTAFDYFPNDAAINDAIYFGVTTPEDWMFKDIKFYVGTAFAAASVTFVWEYYRSDSSWEIGRAHV